MLQQSHIGIGDVGGVQKIALRGKVADPQARLAQPRLDPRNLRGESRQDEPLILPRAGVIEGTSDDEPGCGWQHVAEHHFGSKLRSGVGVDGHGRCVFGSATEPEAFSVNVGR